MAPTPAPSFWDDPRLVFPDEATWARMEPAERERVIERIRGALDEQREAMIPDAAEIVARLQSLADQQQAAIEDAGRRIEDAGRRLDAAHDQLAAAQVAMANGALALWLTRAATAATGDEVFEA